MNLQDIALMDQFVNAVHYDQTGDWRKTPETDVDPDDDQPMQATDYNARLALDRSSVRTVDNNGWMHIAAANISKSNVCPYYGSDIPNYQALGLDAQREYKLLRHPDEMKKAASTFNNVPLLSTHVPMSAHDMKKEIVVGSTGTDAIFQLPYLQNSLVVWDAAAIAGIQSNEQRQLSCGYRYRADMTPGVFQGEAYDGVMRDISGNHVALVEQGRAGNDVVVGDSMENSMTKKALSRKAALVKGALSVFLEPKLAQDANIDLDKLLRGVTQANWPAKKSALVVGLQKATVGKLAQDASLDDLIGLLDRLDPGSEATPDDLSAVVDDGPVDPDAVDPDMTAATADPSAAPMDDTVDPTADPVDPDAVAPPEDTPQQMALAFLKGKISEDDYDEVEAMLGSGDDPDMSDDADPSAPGTAPASPPQNSATPPGPPATPGTPALPATSTKETKVDKTAMDAAIKAATTNAVNQAVQRTRIEMREIAEAEKAVRPFIGEIVIAQDSAEAVYKLALDARGIKLDGVHPSAFKAMVSLLATQTPTTTPVPQAMDAAAATSFSQRFPTAQAIRQL